jgi:hypothetical protein
MACGAAGATGDVPAAEHPAAAKRARTTGIA